MEVSMDNTLLGRTEVASANFLPYRFEAANTTAGKHRVKIAFTNDYWKPPADRNLYVDKIIVYSGASGMAKPQADQTEENDLIAVPATFALSQNYPNPFNPDTYINYQLPEDCQVTITIYNTLGQKIRTLTDDVKSAGYYTALWNGRDDENQAVASGIFFYRISAGDFQCTKKMLLLK